jgi:phosphoribosylglycinamide formyltransferase-1
MNKIAIFASGSGTNAQRITEYFNDKDNVEITLILSNNKDAFVMERAKKLNVPSIIFDRDDFYNSDKVFDILALREIDFIVLAGFLWFVPLNILKKFHNRIINIHPALLPKFGGKGMYGDKVHKAVIENKETETGISIHFVNEKYDEGKIIFQSKFNIEIEDTPDSIAQKIHQLEYEHFPRVIEEVVMEMK